MIAACQDRYHAGITEGPVQETHAYKQRHECLNSCGVSLSKFGARGGRGGGQGGHMFSCSGCFARGTVVSGCLHECMVHMNAGYLRPIHCIPVG
jgi:hypothetical protein